MLSGNLSSRVPVRFLLSGGLALTGVGLLLMHGVSGTSHWTSLLAGFLVAGAGVGLINPPLASTAIGVVPPQRSGMAAGVNNTFRQVGIATGIAVLGALFESGITNHLAPRLAHTPVAGRAAQIAHAVAAGGGEQVIHATPGPLRSTAATAIHSSFATALNEILLVSGIVAIAGGVLALILVRARDFAVYGHPQQREGASEPAAVHAG
jgi:Major Facilitator Superfamily